MTALPLLDRLRGVAKAKKPVTTGAGQAADAAFGEARNLVHSYVGELLDNKGLNKLVSAIHSGKVVGISQIIPDLDEQADQLMQDYYNVLGQVAEASGAKALANLSIPTSFALDNPAVKDFLANETGNLITNITEDVRANIKDMVTQAWTDGIPPDELADMIRPVIGLSSTQYEAVRRRYEASVEAGMSPEDAAKAITPYAEDLLDQRAETIARTETLAAENNGMRSAWGQAQEQGYLRADSKQMWIASRSERTCTICSQLDGQVVNIGEQFHSDELDTDFDGPPAHPRCRCTAGVVDPDAMVTRPEDEDG